jgi:sortase A
MHADPTRWLERTLLFIGILCVGYYWYQTAEARQFQREQRAALEQRLSAGQSSSLATAPDAPDAPGAPSAHSAPSAPSSPGRGAAIALLEIPRLKLATPVLPGDDAATLDLAVGHLPDTPMPWEGGNSAFAAHRDGLFRPLRYVKIGDEVRVRSERGEWVYRVHETKIVTPDDLSVLEPGASDMLTLITCYPFNFIGNAPKRFIVQATRVE